MKAKFAGWIAVMLALAVMLSGCNLIEIDVQMQAEEDIAKIDKAFSAVVAAYDGGEVTANEAMSVFNANYNEMYYMYQYYFGMEMGADVLHDLMDITLSDMVRLEVTAAHFDEKHTLTEEELAQVELDAQNYYDEAYAEMYEYAEGKKEEEKHANALVMLKEVGMDQQTNYENTLRDAKAAKMEEILMDEIGGLSDEDLLAAYEERIIEHEETYSYADGSFESAMMEENPAVCWVPEGYRTVKHILLIPDEQVMTAYSDAAYALEDQQYVLDDLRFELDTLLDNDPETTEDADLLRTEEDIRADIAEAEDMVPVLEAELAAAEKACLDNVKDRSDAIYSRLAAGEDFEALMSEFGEDPGMMNEPTMSRGYYASASSANWEQNFTNGAMILENPGDYSPEPVVSGSGVHIIRYESDVTAGPVAFEAVRDSLYDSTLEDMKYSHCEDTIAAWVEAANPTYDAAAFEKAVFGEF